MKSLSHWGPDERPDGAGSFNRVAMPVVLHEGSNDSGFQYCTLANRGTTLCVSLGGTDAVGCCSDAITMTDQGLLISSAPEPASIGMMLPGLDVIGASIRKRSL